MLQLQSELTQLANPACPVQVADYLSLRCHVTYLQHDVTVRHNLRSALVMTDNIYATKVSILSLSVCSRHLLVFNTIVPTPRPIPSFSMLHAEKHATLKSLEAKIYSFCLVFGACNENVTFYFDDHYLWAAVYLATITYMFIRLFATAII